VILQSPEFKVWYRTRLTDNERDAIVATAMRLQADGPALRRPLSGIIKGSTFPNMKELIPIADAIYERHLAALAATAPSQRPERNKRGRKR
jgi:hypothetical protein